VDGAAVLDDLVRRVGLGVAVILTVLGRQAPPAIETAGEPLTAQEIAEVKATVEKQTGMPVRYVGRNRQGVVEAFAGGPNRGRATYRVKKTVEGWKVVGSFLAFAA
jgi:hypothetical protein